MTSGSFPDLRRLTEQLSQLTADMQRTHEELDAVEVHGVSSEGMVRATMRCGKLTGLVIEPPGMELDPVRLANQVLAAVKECENQSIAMLMRGTAPLAEVVSRTIEDLR